jgi:hypothetical protein
MLNILDFAALSLYIYKSKESKNLILKNFTEIIIDPHIQQHNNNPFYASLFVKVLDKNPSRPYWLCAARTISVMKFKTLKPGASMY